MKKFINFLSVLAVVLFAIACSEDLNLDIKGGEKGDPGIQGSKGDKGDPGHNGYSVVTKVDTVYNSSRDSILGFTTYYYSDLDTNGIYSAGDKWQQTAIFTPYVYSGRNGLDGTNTTTTIKMYILPSSPECSNGTVVFKLYINGVASKDSLYYCVPENGTTYIPKFSSKYFKLTEFTQVHEIFVDDNLLYSDTTHNGQIGPRGSQGESGLPGIAGENGISYYVFQNREDCNSGYSDYYEYTGWLLSLFSINGVDAPAIKLLGFNSPIHNGTLVNWEYWKAPDSVWCPAFQKPSALNYLEFIHGSKKTWKVQMLLKHQDGTVTLGKVENTIPDDTLSWYNSGTYTQKFVYEVKSKDLQYWDVVRWGLLVTKVGDFEISEADWRNEAWDADNFYWTTISPVE